MLMWRPEGQYIHLYFCLCLRDDRNSQRCCHNRGGSKEPRRDHGSVQKWCSISVAERQVSTSRNSETMVSYVLPSFFSCLVLILVPEFIPFRSRTFFMGTSTNVNTQNTQRSQNSKRFEFRNLRVLSKVPSVLVSDLSSALSSHGEICQLMRWILCGHLCARNWRSPQWQHHDHW